MLICTDDRLAPRAKTAAWARAYGDNLDAVDIVPSEPERFSAELKWLQLGPLRLARLTSGPTLMRRDPQTAASCREKTASILFQLSGSSRFEQLGASVRLTAGDASLCDNAAPYDLQVAEQSELLLICAPVRMLKEHLPSPEWFCARLLARDQGMTTPISAMTQALLDGGEASLSDTHQLRMARHLLDLIATSYAIAFDGLATNSSINIGRQASVKLYIEQHLRDPDLTPCFIAGHLKLSPRYLRLIFASANETVSAYILRRRLEECAKQIADPRWRGHSMTEIAFSWGFNSAPHFTRSFRDRFAMSPRDYRRTQLAAETTAPAALAAA